MTPPFFRGRAAEEWRKLVEIMSFLDQSSAAMGQEPVGQFFPLECLQQGLETCIPHSFSCLVSLGLFRK